MTYQNGLLILKITFSRLTDELDTLAKQVNSLALHEDIKNKDGDLVSLPKARFNKDRDTSMISNLKPELHDMLRSSKTEVKNKEKEVASMATAVELAQDGILGKKREVEDGRGEVARLEQEVQEFKEAAMRQEAVFDQELKEIKEELLQLRGQERQDLVDIGRRWVW